MSVAQLDMKTAFLNGILNENVWEMSPRDIPGKPSRCYKLLKAIYGLKEAHLAWHTMLCGDLHGLGFDELPSAPCVFRRKSKSEVHCFTLVYVDDLLMFSPTQSETSAIVEEMKSLYEVRVSENVDIFLRVQLKWQMNWKNEVESLHVCKSLYMHSVLQRFGLENSKPACTPMVESFLTGLAAEDDKSLAQIETYQKMIGALLYLTLRTRSVILAPVFILACFKKLPTAYCHHGVKRVLRYLRETPDVGLNFNRGTMKIQTYVDADYAADHVD